MTPQVPARRAGSALKSRWRAERTLRRIALGFGVLLLAGCRQDMHDQPKYLPLRASSFFADGMASRQLPEGTVARGHLDADTLFFTGKDPAGKPSAELPMAVSAPLVARGRERFDIYCSPCHGRLGDGQGMAARRGFKHPPSFHQDRLRDSPVGYYFDVITHGFGVMPSYAVSVPAADRWAIVAYIRALQLSQRAHLTDLDAADRQALGPAPSPTPGAAPIAGAAGAATSPSGPAGQPAAVSSAATPTPAPVSSH